MNTELVRLPTEPTQDLMLTAPTMMAPSLMGGHTDRAPNLSENTTRQEDVYHYYKLWRQFDSFTITPDSIGRLSSYTNTYSNLLTHFGTFGMLGRAGVKWDLEFRVQVFSSSCQQGALAITKLPISKGDFNTYGLKYGNSPIDTDLPSFYTQYNTQIVPFGKDQEIIVPFPWTFIYPYFLFSNPKQYNSILSEALHIYVFDSLNVVEGGHNSLQVNVQMRCSNIEFIGSSWSSKKGMGVLVIE